MKAEVGRSKCAPLHCILDKINLPISYCYKCWMLFGVWEYSHHCCQYINVQFGVAGNIKMSRV
jgi:hypothetical protein